MTNVGKWDTHYANSPFLMPMGDSEVYRMGADAFARAGVTEVEDWGAGYGWFEVVLGSVAPTVKYIGVDGSSSPGHDRVIDDLVTRVTSVEGIFMRSVLEHNYDWEALLDNALSSFTKLLVVATFTPFTKKKPHEELRFEDDFGVPTLALNLRTLLDHFVGQSTQVIHTTIMSPNTAYGTETIFEVTRG